MTMIYENEYSYEAERRRRHRRRRRRRRFFFRLIRNLIVLAICLFALWKVFLWNAPHMGLGAFASRFANETEAEETASTEFLPPETEVPEAPPETIQETERESEAIPPLGDSEVCYYYHQLDEAARQDYDKILHGFLEMDEKILVGTSVDELHALVAQVLADHPELFWVNTSYQYLDYRLTLELRPEYNCSIEERQRRQQQIDDATAGIHNRLNGLDSDYDRVRAVYDYIINTVDYDLNSPDNQNIYSSLVNHVSVCAGYAKAAQYLLQQSGIQAFYVTGTIVPNGDHGWDIVRIDGKYYHVDPTFGDPTFRDNDSSSSTSLPEELVGDYAYLCCDDAVIYRDRRVDEELPIPECTDDSLNYYRRNGLYYEDYTKQLRKDIQRQIKNGAHSFQVQLATEEAFRTMVKALENGAFGDWILKYRKGLRSAHTYYYYNDQTYVIKLWYVEE